MDKVWVDKVRDMNKEYAFCAKVSLAQDGVLKIACSNAYQIFLDGEFFCYGPLRSAHGYSLEASYTLTKGERNVTILVVEYAINSYYMVNEKAFLSVEIACEGKTICSSSDFSAYEFFERVQKVERLCLQRNFCEYYKLGSDRVSNNEFLGKSVPLINVPGNTILTSELTLPRFDRLSFSNVIEEGKIYFQKDGEYYKYSAPQSGVINDICLGYDYPQLDARISDEVCKFGYTVSPLKNANELENEYKLYDLGVNKSGFIQAKISVLDDDVSIYFAFDEILYNEVNSDENMGKYFLGDEQKLVFHRLLMVNAVKYLLKKGEYTLTTFEPYTLKFLKVIVSGGRAKINALDFILYENADADNLVMSCDNSKLQSVFNAAKNTLAQNAVDVLTDCPSRERAGWLCDSFFSGRAEKIFTGDNKVERNFLNNYLIMPKIEEIPMEIPPMCYPADHLNAIYIPNWSMWFVIELYDYLDRTGDSELVQKFQNKVHIMLDYFITNFSNSDGLLEKLDKWVFIEWSNANLFTQDVNYPTNMLFYACLKCAYKLFGAEKYNILANKIKLKIIEQSFNGEFFEDNSVYIDGKLSRTGNTSETCQYYAMFFKIADKENFGQLYKTMSEFGAKRDESKVFPKIYKSNAFIGNFLRLELIRQTGNYKKALDECIDYLYYQSERTGTLWENMNTSVSCNHGFSSYVACIIIEALCGYKGEKDGNLFFTDNFVGEDCSIVLPLKNKRYKITISNGKRSIDKIL